MSDLEQLYQQVILDHAKRRVGNLPLTGPDAAAVASPVASPGAGRGLVAGSDADSGGDGTGGTAGTVFGSSHQVNPTCGDEITVEARLDPQTGQIDMRWDGEGCSISMASASVLADMLDELDGSEFAAVEAAFHELMHSRGRGEADEDLLGDAAAFVGVSKFPARIKCALLAWMALKDALVQAQSAAGDA